jgi:hypothetical protein
MDTTKLGTANKYVYSSLTQEKTDYTLNLEIPAAFARLLSPCITTNTSSVKRNICFAVVHCNNSILYNIVT